MAAMGGGEAQRDHFSVGGRVLICLATVVTTCEQRTSAIDDDAADGNIPVTAGEIGLSESPAHPGFVID